MADHREIWTIGVGVIAAVLIALAGLNHSHAKTALALAAIGVVASWFVAYSIGIEREKRHVDYPDVQLSNKDSVVFTDSLGEYTVVWFQMRAKNTRQGTVLTDWEATVTLNDTTHTASHRFGESFVPGMLNPTALDQATASTPLHGEITGWVAFGVATSKPTIMSHLEGGFAASARVSVHDSQDKVIATDFDLAKGFHQHHHDLPDA